MNRWSRSVALTCLVMQCAACASDQLSRNIYDGVGAHNESLKSTPMDQSKGEPLTYDQYQRERQRSASGR